MSEPQTNPDSILIVGGGHAAAQLCAALAAAGLGARVQLVCAEAELPYQRPPLSKAFLKNPEETLQLHRGEDWYAQAGIAVHRSDAVVAIDRERRLVRLRSGLELGYARLVLATGSHARSLPGLAPGLANVATLRSAADALRLRALVGSCNGIAVLGGGFIGLEIAATARALGKSVTVLESAPRLLMRSVSPELADHVRKTHCDGGIDVRLGAKVTAFDVRADRLVAIEVDGRREPVELLVLGVGAEPATQLARDAGLPCDNGIVVDACLRTADPAILAVGDCANFPQQGSGARVRLESVQNANDQARTALATLLGREEPYAASPWFWSDQGSLRLQMAGLMPHDGSRHRRPGATAASFSILHYRGEQLVCAESVNAPLDHMAARKLLEAGRSPAAALACDAAVPLKSHL